MKFTTALWAASLGFCLAACGTKQEAKSTLAAPSVAKDSLLATRNAPTQTVRTWRVNDTLELECSRPLATFTTEGQPTPQLVWGQLALRGRRGWYKVLAEHSYWTLYHVLVAPDGKLFQLPTVGVEDQIDAAQTSPKKPLKITEEDFFYNTYDVAHLTWTEYLDEELSALPARQIAPDYLGGELDDKIYYPLPYWLAQEKTRLQASHHLPAAAQLAAYLKLSQDTAAHTGRLRPPYRSLLADLLRAYQPYSLSPDTTRLLQDALRSLALPASSKPK
jgi:hypothetical protein